MSALLLVILLHPAPLKVALMLALFVTVSGHFSILGYRLPFVTVVACIVTLQSTLRHQGYSQRIGGS